MEIYRKAAEDNANLAKSMKKFVTIGHIVTFAPSTLIPISYMILGVPEPDDWLEPFDAKY